MLALNLNNIKTPHERFDQTYEPGVLPTGAGDLFKVVAPVDLGFDIYKDKDHFRLVGHVRTRLELPCSRCLEPFTSPVDADFDLRYQPHSANTGEGEREVEEDDLTTAFYENDQIDLGGLMHEQFYLSLPMKPLCGAGCKGLCATCGTNLSTATCDCHTEWEDPRLAALKSWKKDS